MGNVDRRQVLRGGLAAAVLTSAVTAASALVADDELGRLIAAHQAAEAELDYRCSVFSDFEEEYFAARSASTVTDEMEEEHARLQAWVDDTRGGALLWALMEYRPRNLAEASRRSQYLLSDPSILEGLSGKWVEALVASFLPAKGAS